jgi:urea transporter
MTAQNGPQAMGEMLTWQKAALGGLAATVAATTLAFVLGDWYLTCQSDAGTVLQGIDCLQYRPMPRSTAAPLRWIGFVPLAALWFSGLAGIFAIPLFTPARER